jgi:hypothetical protein
MAVVVCGCGGVELVVSVLVVVPWLVMTLIGY